MAPLDPASGRFFYFEDVRPHDHLFLELMRVLGLGGCPGANSVRSRKKELLKRFQADGCYLDDVGNQPLRGEGRARLLQLEEACPSFVERVRAIVVEETKIILISKYVFDVCYEPLKAGIR